MSLSQQGAANSDLREDRGRWDPDQLHPALEGLLIYFLESCLEHFKHVVNGLLTSFR